jgi:transcriptional regulator with XRE-family HTH domain
VILRCARDLTRLIRPARQARGVSQLAYASRHGFNRQQIHNWEKAIAEPELRSAIRLAGALGYDLALVPREERT